MFDSVTYFNHVILSITATVVFLIIACVLTHLKINHIGNIPGPLIYTVEVMAVLAAFAPLLWEGLKFIMGV